MIFSMAPGNWQFDVSDNRLYWSEEQYMIYGYEPGEIEPNDGFLLEKTTHISDFARINCIIARALENEDGYQFKRRVIKKDGRLGFLETRATILRSPNGRPERIVGFTYNAEGNEEQGYDANDPIFFNRLYTKYRNAIFSEVFKTTGDNDISKDLCQEIFVKAWNKMSSYDKEKGGLYTWLKGIARNHCKDFFRSKYAKIELSDIGTESNSLENVMGESFNYERVYIKELMSMLSNEQKEMLDLLFIKGYTQSEVAALKKIPLGSVKTKSRKAISMLRDMVVAIP